MAVNENNLDAGVASGTVVTTGNSGGAAGRAFTEVTGSPTYDDTHVHGVSGLSMMCDQSGGDAYVRWLDGVAQATGETFIRCYVWLDVHPVDNVNMVVVTTTANAFKGRLRVLPSGLLQWQDNTFSQMCVTTTPIATGQWVRIEGRLTTSATTGEAEIRLYHDPESGAATETVASAAAFNTLADNPGGWRFGADIGGATADVLWMDDIASDPTDWIGASIVDPGPAVAPAGREWVEGNATPRAVWQQDRTVITDFSNELPVPGSPEVGVVFVAPESGRALVVIGGMVRDNTGVQRVFLRPEIYRGTSGTNPNERVEDGAFKEFGSSPPETAYMAGSRAFIAKGLEPGREYYARCTHWTENPGGQTLFVADIGAREIVVVPQS